MTVACSRDELLIATIARLLQGEGNVAVGSSSPIPAAAALLAQATSKGATRALVFRNSIQDPFPESASELYDRIGQGRIDVFFLGGGQIDGEANLNMVGVGGYPKSRVRFPGCHGTPFIYMMVPRTILFREEHSPRVLVPKVDFISAPGTSPPQHLPPRGADRSRHRDRPFPIRSRAPALHSGERPPGARCRRGARTHRLRVRVPGRGAGDPGSEHRAARPDSRPRRGGGRTDLSGVRRKQARIPGRLTNGCGQSASCGSRVGSNASNASGFSSASRFVTFRPWMAARTANSETLPVLVRGMSRRLSPGTSHMGQEPNPAGGPQEPASQARCRGPDGPALGHSRLRRSAGPP